MTYRDLVAYLSHGCPFSDLKDQLKDYVYTLSKHSFEQGDGEREEIITQHQHQLRIQKVRKAFLDSIGGLPQTEQPVSAKTVGVIQQKDFRIEKILFSSRKDVFVTGNLYLPEKRKTPVPAVLLVCGHQLKGKHSEEYQKVCQVLVKAGLVVLAIDPIGQGERYSYYEPHTKECSVPPVTFEHDQLGYQCNLLGQNLARYMLHDNMRAIDYLLSRSEVDGRVAVTGNSGGGTQTAMMMMADERIAAAIPGTFIMAREMYQRTGQAQDREQHWRGLTALGIDHEDFLLSMAPRPVLVLAAQNDFFPIEGTMRTVERCKKYWDMYGEKENLELFVQDTEHSYTVQMAYLAAEFLCKHFGMPYPSSEILQSVEPLNETTLFCTNSGQLLEDGLGKSVFEENLQQLNCGKRNWNKSLRRAVFRNRTSDLPFQKLAHSGEIGMLEVKSIVWHTQKNMLGHMLIFKNKQFCDKTLPVFLLLTPNGTFDVLKKQKTIENWCEQGYAVVVPDVSGTGMLRQRSLVWWAGSCDEYGALYKLNDDLFWLNDSLAALRIFELLSCLRLLSSQSLLQTDLPVVLAEENCQIYAAALAQLHPIQFANEQPNLNELYNRLLQDKHYDRKRIWEYIIPYGEGEK